MTLLYFLSNFFSSGIAEAAHLEESSTDKANK